MLMARIEFFSQTYYFDYKVTNRVTNKRPHIMQSVRWNYDLEHKELTWIIQPFWSKSENLGKYWISRLLKSSKVRFNCNIDGSEGAAAELSTVVRRQIFDIAL